MSSRDPPAGFKRETWRPQPTSSWTPRQTDSFRPEAITNLGLQDIMMIRASPPEARHTGTEVLEMIDSETSRDGNAAMMRDGMITGDREKEMGRGERMVDPLRQVHEEEPLVCLMEVEDGVEEARTIDRRSPIETTGTAGGLQLGVIKILTDLLVLRLQNDRAGEIVQTMV
ncbi:hypothetical protein BD324DRAFT_647642 [Kockovaella imperatae]|uniref:Uncharacterized protein n=1 Tax=Kockovaella imperatae TaxID=4999 RepID=A0A1Y1UU66_9TREE|nr:hypothetical protein BD324DRAFT_647642 [Kockovaella imperatae]ORX40725.1 hypothetical protein BD324DRAFT_647642 [Kockovaella imperatae]